MRPATLLLAAFFATGPPVLANSIVQGANFNYRDHGTTFSTFSQFDPSLGTLNAVLFEESITVNYGFEIVNPTSAPLTFNVTESISVSFDAGSASKQTVVPITLPAFGTNVVGPTLSVTGAEATLRTNLSQYIGKGQLMPGFAGGGNAQPDNPAIQVTYLTGVGSAMGGETITYVYTDPIVTLPPNAEPTSVVMLAIGLAVVGAVGWRRR